MVEAGERLKAREILLDLACSKLEQDPPHGNPLSELPTGTGGNAAHPAVQRVISFRYTSCRASGLANGALPVNLVCSDERMVFRQSGRRTTRPPIRCLRNEEALPSISFSISSIISVL